MQARFQSALRTEKNTVRILDRTVSLSGGAKMNRKQKILVVFLDILILSELTLAMYLSAQSPEDFTGTFLRIFIPLAAATFILGMIGIRKSQ